ncbi:MAG: hypothetical protein LAO31_21315 [Acidobacteriia bacterium]|nr:hypothetical protein [Terriglobia bacterium]
MSNGTRSTWQMIQIPAVITLVITLLRLIGELQHWSPRFFNPEPGGPGAIVGIVWLVPIFGIYFAMKLAQQEGGPESKGKAIGLQLLGIAIFPGAIYLGFVRGWEYTGYILMMVSWIVFAMAWGGLAKTLFAYGFAARIPVVIVMALAIWNNWNTHYNAFPPRGFPYTTFVGKFWHGAVLPQLILWITFTLAVGGLFGIVTSFFVRKPSLANQTA